ncbi:hypothetical protein SOVF_006180 [Spinacia oleracea]|uniref:Uncharacterized protein n=1 Tax=Spinacia oleracea TaxID=3562 RepID=A0A9R0IHR2_SPIOL|nr:uncharacterized protein LOC110789216 [Spinacia oleracea]KNA25508.1 hypothetical protein SOVF_006180 [Spinacia oleracea]
MLKFGRNHNLQALYFIHCFCRPLLYSTLPSSSSDSHPSLQIILADYLGFPNKIPLSSTKLSLFLQSQEAKKVSNSDFAKNVDSIVKFFKQIGFQQSQIRKVISYDPRLLCTNVDKTLNPKIKLLKDLGFSDSDLVHAILANPIMLNRRLGPAIDALREVVGTDQNVIKIMRRSKWLSFTAFAKHLFPNVILLQNYGISSDKITNYILQQPSLFLRKTDLFRDMLIRVEEKFRIPRNSAMFLPAIQLTSFKEETFEGKCDVYKSFGWTQSDIMTLTRKNPNCLRYSEAGIKKKLDFLMKEVGYEPSYLVSNYSLLTYSLDNRIVPRYRMLLFLKEKSLMTRDYNFGNVARMTESMFLMKFVEPFKDIVPHIHQVYRHLIPPTQGKAASLC